MARVIVEIGDRERSALERLAKRERRIPRSQAAFIIRQALERQGILIDDEWANIQAGQAWSMTYSAQDQTAMRLCSDYADAGAYVLEWRKHPFVRIRWRESASKAARSLKWPSSESAHLSDLGLAYADLGEFSKAIEFFENSLSILQEIRDRQGEGNILINLGNACGEGLALQGLGIAYTGLGKSERALDFFEQHRKIALEFGDRHGEGAALGNIGIAYKRLGETGKAIELFEQRLVIAREIGDQHGEANTLGSLGNTYTNLGEFSQAIKYFLLAPDINRTIGNQSGEALNLWNLSVVFDKLGNRKQAIINAELALKIRLELGDSLRAKKVRSKLAIWKADN